MQFLDPKKAQNIAIAMRRVCTKGDTTELAERLRVPDLACTLRVDCLNPLVIRVDFPARGRELRPEESTSRKDYAKKFERIIYGYCVREICQGLAIKQVRQQLTPNLAEF